MFVPSAKVAPEGKFGIKLASEQLSAASGGIHTAVAEQVPAVAVWRMSAGTFVIVGATPSKTVTSKVAVAVRGSE